MEGYKFIDHPADIAVEVTAGTIEKLFEISAEAWKYSALENTSAESPFELHFEIESSTLEGLLVEFLGELNFILCMRKLVFSKIKQMIIKEDGQFKITASIYFEDFNPDLHRLKDEIKAITFHQMNIVKKGNNYFTRIIFDI